SGAPVVRSAPSGLVSKGGTASPTPAALVDGTHHWQARAVDVAGNQSGWSATRSFQLDTSLPVVTVGAPADGAWVNGLELSAIFSKPAFAGTGSVEFRVCSDALCLGTVRNGNSGTLVNGALAKWSPSSLPVDGLYYWQARSHDSAGNVSAWTAIRTLHLDTVAPGKPLTVNGVVAADGLTLRWSAPNEDARKWSPPGRQGQAGTPRVRGRVDPPIARGSLCHSTSSQPPAERSRTRRQARTARHAAVGHNQRSGQASRWAWARGLSADA